MANKSSKDPFGDPEPTMDLDEYRRRQRQSNVDTEQHRASAYDEKRIGPSPRLGWPARDNADAPTERRRSPGNIPVKSAPADDITRLVGAERPNKDLIATSEQAPRGSEAHRDPVVGWLVITNGPGRGHSLELGMGANAIGRSEGQKIRLDFGDQLVSRERHAIVIFDPRNRQFFIERGNARNLVYLGNELVLMPRELRASDVIIIGETELTFVPFCGPHFSWQL